MSIEHEIALGKLLADIFIKTAEEYVVYRQKHKDVSFDEFLSLKSKEAVSPKQ